METLLTPLQTARPGPATIVPVTLPRASRPAWWLRALLALWQEACRQAESPGRRVPYY